MLLVCLGGSDGEGWYRRVRVGQAREFSIENRADEPVLVTIEVDVLVIASLEFLDIPFFVNQAAYEGTELRVSFINDILVGLDVGRPSPDCLVDSVYVMFFQSRLHLKTRWANPASRAIDCYSGC